MFFIMLSLEGKALLGDSSFRLAKKPKTCQHSLRMTLNIAFGSEANMTTPCEMEIFNFLWLIWDHYLPLAPT